VLVQLAKQLQVCAAGKAARLVNAVTYERVWCWSQLQVCTAGKAARLVNAVTYERTRLSRLVQPAKQLKVCAAGKAAQLVNAVAYVAMRECTRRSRLV